MKNKIEMAMEFLDNAASEGIGGFVVSLSGTMTITDVERYREYIENSGFHCSYTRQKDETNFGIWL